ncbi:MAG: dihydrodipicolinate synthase family protein [Kurthia sp.]|nr:dihydrodipicolinate synthase family protein [Candidatus Kurthia equi]
MKLTEFYGVIPPVPSILNEKGHIDEKGMGNLIDSLITSGVDGLFFLGSGGEFAAMSHELKKEVAEFSTKYVNGRVPVLIGTGATGTEETIELSLHAKEVGADGVVIINPYYYNLSEEDLFQHYAEIAQNVDLPIILYNFPELTKQDLSPQLVLQLAKASSNIVGIKETVLSVGHIREMIQAVKPEKPDFAIFSGYDEHFLNVLALGGDGSIGGTANFAPEIQVELYEAFNNGNYGQAIEAHRNITSLMPLYKINSTFMNVVKEAIKLRGIDISTNVVAPTRPLSDEKKNQVKKYLNELLIASEIR